MELELARTIVTEAISGEFLDEMPGSDNEILEQAEYFAKEAKKAYNEGWGKSNETVVAIVNLSPSEEPDKFPDQAASQKNKESGAGSSAFFSGLPLPQSDGTDPAIPMPFNIATLDDAELRKYHGIFNHYFGRVRYALAEETAKLVSAQHLRDEAFRKAFSKVDKRDKTIKAQETEAMEDSEYASWNRNALEHEQNVVKLKALSEIYSKNVEVLSREATIRQNEFERSR